MANLKFGDSNFAPDLAQHQIPITETKSLRAVTVANTRVALATTALFTKGCFIKAAKSNGVKDVLIGGPAVNATTGYPLEAGESVPWQVNDLSTVYIWSDTDGLVVHVLYGR